MKINVYTNKHVPGAEYCVYTAIGTQAVKKGRRGTGEGDKGAKREQKGAKREPHVSVAGSAA